ncbi:MAG: terminase small subunit [Hungatella hathewayi]|uniref:terminase small subunit n=1 Tax=Hungatella TaxID=1649459 RepID=UPI0011066174|nr:MULTISPECIES: terminase small subunit [Hungatella]MCI7383721.1 terminase small subunit [Hungatella sp.]MDY6239643.1 terminase small subunit [Hungatella hathewayi]
MTQKQKRFIEEYLIDLNATQAAIRAGYSPNNADKIGSELLGKTRVSDAIKTAMAERSKRTGINQDRILMELAKIALVNPENVVNFDEATIREDALPEDLAAVASVKVKRFPTKDGEGIEREIKFYDKTKALDLAGRHLGMFKDKLELSGGLDTEKTKLDDLLQQMRGGG